MWYPGIYVNNVNNGYIPIWDKSLISNIYIDTSNGSEIAYNGWSATDFIDISDNSDGVIYRLGRISQATYNAFYDSEKNFISSIPTVGINNGGNTIPANAKYVRFSNTTTAMLGEVLIIKE